MLEHLPSLRAFAMSLTRDCTQADDLAQETIMRAWANTDQFQVATNMRAWMFTILRILRLRSSMTLSHNCAMDSGKHFF